MAEKKEKKQVKRPTALKRDLQNAKRQKINQMFKSRMRTSLRRFLESLEGADTSAIQGALNNAYGMLDRAYKRGLMKKNASSRTKSRLASKAKERGVGVA